MRLSGFTMAMLIVQSFVSELKAQPEFVYTAVEREATGTAVTNNELKLQIDQ